MKMPLLTRPLTPKTSELNACKLLKMPLLTRLLAPKPQNDSFEHYCVIIQNTEGINIFDVFEYTPHTPDMFLDG